ncbi:MAG: hypothetical protein ACRCZF_10915 [Gemmataceae bacterium]
MFAHLTVMALVTVSAPADYPQANLERDNLKLTLYHPDAAKGFYRGTRFDWSGVLQVDYAGHKIFGPWKGGHNPANNDDIVGPAEEFGHTAPLGYATAKPGEVFLKIGVGDLEKPNEEKYRFWFNYTIKNTTPWAVTKQIDRVTYRQQHTSATGFAYDYSKTIALLPNAAGFEIVHTLKNTGAKPIDTDCYNHNFWNVDGEPVGPKYQLSFPFAPLAVGAKEQFDELVKLEGKHLTLKKAPGANQSLFAELTGYGATATDHQIVFRHLGRDLIMTVKGDQPISKLNVWGIGSTLCPEPYVRVKADAGASTTWSTRYTFFRGGGAK